VVITLFEVSSQREFIIFNSNQIKLCKLIKFDGENNLLSSENENFCILCGEQPDVIWCVNDQAQLSEKCDHGNHQGNRLQQGHK
jgi:hypothetical protein